MTPEVAVAVTAILTPFVLYAMRRRWGIASLDLLRLSGEENGFVRGVREALVRQHEVMFWLFFSSTVLAGLIVLAVVARFLFGYGDSFAEESVSLIGGLGDVWVAKLSFEGWKLAGRRIEEAVRRETEPLLNRNS